MLNTNTESDMKFSNFHGKVPFIRNNTDYETNMHSVQWGYLKKVLNRRYALVGKSTQVL